MDDLPLRARVAAKVLLQRARERGDAPFVHCRGEWHGYASINRRANRAAHALRARGVSRATRVAIALANRVEYLELWFALSKLGAIQVPIGTDLRSRQIRALLQRSQVVLVVVQQDLLPEVCAACADLDEAPVLWVLDAPDAADIIAGPGAKATSYERALEGFGGEEPEGFEDVSGADAAAIMSTSGTTGPSKGVLLSHAQQYILGRTIAADLELSASDVYYNCFPLFHNTAQAMITLPALLSGARMVLVPRFSASGFWADVQAQCCTTFYYIGETLRILLAITDAAEQRGRTLRAGWGIGASASDFDEFQRRFGVPLHTGYGSTEANVPCVLPRENRKRGSAGRPLPSFEIRIQGSEGDEAPPNVAGEILVRSSEPCALMLGYDADPDATVAAWRDLWLHTGDQGFVDPDGDLFFVGRLKDAIRVRGENVSAFEVEEVVAEIDGVIEVAAIAVPCELGGDDVKVVIVARSVAALRPQRIVEWARQRLPRHAVPRYVQFVDSLPRTPTNKVQKHLLRREPFGAGTWDSLQDRGI